MTRLTSTDERAAPPPALAHDDRDDQHDGGNQHDGDDHDGGSGGMVEMARQNERAHLAPVPEATAPEIWPFPRPLLLTSWFGMLLGAIVGLLFAWALIERLLVIPGWEQLYSMTPGTFATFWLGIGSALGLLLAGVAAILVTPARPRPAAGDDERATPRAEEPVAVTTDRVREAPTDPALSPHDDGKRGTRLVR